MRLRLIVGAGFVIGAWNAAAEATYQPTVLPQTCLEFNQSIASQIDAGRLADAETAMSKGWAGKGDLHDESCAWISLQNAANIANLQGRLPIAEGLALQSYRIANRLFPANDSRRLPSLQLLWSIQTQSGRRAEARRTFEAIVHLHLNTPQERATVNGAAAVQLQAERKFAESEVAYREALSAGEEAGRGKSANQALVLCGLGSLYLDQNRVADADLTMSRARALLNDARDATPTDYIHVRQALAVMHARRKQWTAADEDLRSAIALADGIGLYPDQMKVLLANRAYVLRKGRRPKEARVIESRVAAIHDTSVANALVDVTEFQPGSPAGRHR